MLRPVYASALTISAAASARAALAAATFLRVMRLRAFLLVVGAARPLRVATGRAADVAGARGPAVHVVGRAHAAVAALALKLLFLGAFLLRGALRLAGLSVGDWSRADGERHNSRESQRCHAHEFSSWVQSLVQTNAPDIAKFLWVARSKSPPSVIRLGEHARRPDIALLRSASTTQTRSTVETASPSAAGAVKHDQPVDDLHARDLVRGRFEPARIECAP